MAGKGGGGAWKVAYADFVTAMMAFFLVMWITAQSEQVKEAVAQHFTDPYSAHPSPDKHAGAGTETPPPRQHAQEPPETPPSADAEHRAPHKPNVLAIRDSDHTGIGNVVFFTDDSAELDQEAQGRLKRLVPMLAGKPQKIEIRGHASHRPLPPESPYQDAWQLSYARSLATMKFLEQEGIALERMRLSQAGAYESSSPGGEEQWQGREERVEVHVLDEWVHELVKSLEKREEPTAEPSTSLSSVKH